MITSTVSSAGAPADDLHTEFLAILPRIERHARIRFRDVACADRREEFVAESVALAWAGYRALVRKGKDVTQFVSALAGYAARAARCGRRVAGMDRARDVLSPVARRRHGFTVASLPSSSRTAHEELYGTPSGQRELDAFEERLADNTVTPVPEQASFRIDFRAWRLSRSDRDRRLVDALMRGERTRDIARAFGLTPSRVSQKRRAFYEDWTRYCADPTEAAETS